MSSRSIPRKQKAQHEHFVAALTNIELIISRTHYEVIKQKAVKRVKLLAGKKPAYAWSGGKDSLALQIVCEAAGVTACVLGMTNLEYPRFLQWITDHMPYELTVYSNGWDYDWLKKNQSMIFPMNASIAADWFRGTQHAAQDRYFKKHKPSVLFLGRRIADGNYVGQQFVYEKKGMRKASPIADWSHEEVLACLHYEGLAVDLPPFYQWPRGYRCGTHSFPARQWCDSIYHGWDEIFFIDKSLVVNCAEAGIDSAKHYLDCQ
jgi:3'-phosphoadenosine 5'-phosphosulfate sulfotransferase (PAPS reductase)/FAD synthetase